MAKRPTFDLSDLPTIESLTRCKNFVEKLEESNRSLTKGLKSGTIDANLEIVRNDVPDLQIKEPEDQSIVLEVGAGVFDVKGNVMTAEAAQRAGVMVVDIDNEIVKEPLPLITELDRQTKCEHPEHCD